MNTTCRGRAVVRGLVVALTALLVAGLMGVGQASAATQPPSFTRTDYPQLGSNHTVGDFNGDGRLDLAGQGTNATAVKLATGDGTFGTKVAYPVAGQVQDLASGDFNNDGKVDLAVSLNDPVNSLSLLKGNGDGTFGAPINVLNTTGLDSPSVVAADLDDDGKLDLVLAHALGCFTAPCIVGRTVSILDGNGDATFLPAREVEVGTGMTRIAVGDFDRSGGEDLAIAGDRAQVYRLYGAGDGQFVQQPTLQLVANDLFVDGSDIDVADFNRDGIQDLVVAIATNGSRTGVLIGNADGTFRPPLILTDSNLRVPHQQAVGDFNRDGFADLALGNADGTQGLVQIRNGNGDGTFQTSVFLFAPPPKSSIGAVALISANLNGDDKPDLALGIGGASPGLAVLLNSTGGVPPPTPGKPTLLSPGQDAKPPQPVAFDWSNATNAASYQIEADDSSAFSAPLVIDATVAASQFTAPPTLAPVRHWWRVRGINAAGVAGPWSAVRRFTPKAAPSQAVLASVVLDPTNVVGGTPSQGTATLTGSAPAGGLQITLSSSNPGVATVPAGVTVAAGATSAVFTVATSPVSQSTSVTITGVGGGVTRTANLSVTPPAQNAVLTVTATGRSGERVTSSPAGINVPVGSNGSASFAVGTAITLSATNNRDVIWSGACSSGGQKTRTCTFTLNGTASVTANVQ